MQEIAVSHITRQDPPNFRKHEYIEKRTVYDKSVITKNTPIADYHLSRICKHCGEVNNEIGYIIAGTDCPYGTCVSFIECPGPKEGEHAK